MTHHDHLKEVNCHLEGRETFSSYCLMSYDRYISYISQPNKKSVSLGVFPLQRLVHDSFSETMKLLFSTKMEHS